MLRNNADARRCSYFELGLPVECQIIIRINEAFVHDQESIARVIFFKKGKLVLRSLLSEGCYFRGEPYFRDLL